MLDICLLGTGGMMPLPYRHLTSLMARLNGSSLLIDCGEGTQIAMKKAGWSPNPVDVIAITHFHADHISGLPGLLLAMGNADRTEPLLMVGPKGLTRVVNALRVIAPELPFPIVFKELEETEETFTAAGFTITAFKVNHKIPCYGYTLEVKRTGEFSVEKAKSAGIPLMYWNRLQKGEIIEAEGRTFTPDMVLGPDRKGLKVCYVTDTRPIERIVDQARGSDLFICEGMYGEPGMEEKAREKKHMTFTEAAGLGKEAAPKEMWLTHFSPSLNRPEEYLDKAQKIFPAVIVPKDGRKLELSFED